MTHYTAVIIIEKVEEEQPAEYDQYNKLKKIAVPRKTSEIGKIVVRSEEIGLLIDKVKEHVSLISED